MKEKDLPIDCTRHEVYTKKAKQCVLRLLHRDYDDQTCEQLWEKIQLQYCEFLRDEPPMAGAKIKVSIYDPILIFALPYWPPVFRHGSGAGWRYEWHLDTDPKDRFHFECKECLYRHIFEERGLMKLGAMFCHSDVINFGNLPYTDFKRTKTLCQGGDCCDFDFVHHETDAGDGWERTKSI